MLSDEEIDELASDDRFLFARAVERATIERCAKVCVKRFDLRDSDLARLAASKCADAIRAMLEEKP